jgi:hypothetical protein
MFNNLNKYPVQYDFNTLDLNLLDKYSNKLKSKYICLGYMITMPLIQSPKPNSAIYQPIPMYKNVTLNSTEQIDGYLNFNIPPINNDTIITSNGVVLDINYYLYYYDVTINIINKGNIDNVQLRAMTFNYYQTSYASNLNDINGNETVYMITPYTNNIKFTITGEYVNFFIYYPNNNFEISINVTVSKQPVPTWICNKQEKCKNKCKKKCKCFEINNVGYITVKNDKCKNINVPVYLNIDKNGINTFLYPTFANLREIFLSTTINNSLPAPIVIDTITENFSVDVSFKSQGFYYGGFNNNYDIGTLFTNNPPPPENGIIIIYSDPNSESGTKPWIIRNVTQKKTGYIKYTWGYHTILTSAAVGLFTNKLALTVYGPGNGISKWASITYVDIFQYQNEPKYILKPGSFYIP